jgi:hypothetical protein
MEMGRKRLRLRTLKTGPQRDQAGQQMVEFTFTFVLLTIILMALVLFAYVFFMYASIVHAAQRGTRHLLTYPVLPQDEDRFATADQEAAWVITSSVPLLNWRENMHITIEPPVDERALGTYVSVRILYDVPLPQFTVPLVFSDQSITVLPPIELRAVSRRALNWQ